MKKTCLTLGAIFALTLATTSVSAQTTSTSDDIINSSSKPLSVSVSGDSNDRHLCMLKKRRGQALPEYCYFY